MLYRKTLLETEYVVLSVDDHWYREKILCIIFTSTANIFKNLFLTYRIFAFFFANSLMHYSLFFMYDKMAIFFNNFF